MGKGKKRAKKMQKPALTAASADRHRLYELSVQAPDFEVDLLTSVFKRRVGRRPFSLREDFCGTALLSCEWVASDPLRTATGVDVDAAVLAYGRASHVEPLGEGAPRVTLVEGDVRDRRGARHDIVVAFNYSSFYFKDRATLRGYFEAAKHHLVPDGLFFVDLFGGYEAQQVQEEERRYKGFNYVWDQAFFNPITADFRAHIHFKFRDGTKLERAFTYEWRFWTIPELRELLEEAGFRHIECLWEEEDEEGEGTGEFRPRKKAINDASYNAYLVASLTDPPPAKKKVREKTKIVPRTSAPETQT